MSPSKGYQTFRKTIDGGFNEWCYKIYPELSIAYSEAIKMIDDNPVAIEQQLEILSTHLPRINGILSFADAFLDIEAYKNYTNEGENALHRKLRNDYNVAEVRAIRNKVAGLVKSVETRITVLQSRLKSSRDALHYSYQK